MGRGSLLAILAIVVVVTPADQPAQRQGVVPADQPSSVAVPAPCEQPPAALSRTRSGAGRASVASGQSSDLDAQLRARLRDRYGAADLEEFESRHRMAGSIKVPVRFHTVTAGRSGQVSRSAIKRQIAQLNAAYGGELGGVDTGVSFRLTEVHTVDNAKWFHRPRKYERPMLRSLRRGGPGTLNLVTAGVGEKLLGFSTFPQWYAQAPYRDGVVVDYRTMPGGRFRDFSKGFTAVHETGHWLGLFHTFENGCRRPGDHVDDTPYEAAPAQGCPAAKDTCPRSGTDPVHNFMNYSRDVCMREFSHGQARRIRAVWAAYRAGSPGYSAR